jgi:ornithine cyclodeaminase
MKILILNHDEVFELLPMKECIALMREALLKLAAGEVHQPLRTIVRPPDAAGVMGLMPSYVGGEQAAYGLKTVCIFPTIRRRVKMRTRARCCCSARRLGSCWH